MVLWFTGQPGSGKTTLTNRFIDDKLIGFMKIHPVRIVHIDGDDLRDIVDNKDYSEQGRRENINLAMNVTTSQIFEFILQLFIWTVLITMAIDAFKRIYWHIKTVLDDPKHFFFFQISWPNKTINF